MEVQRLLAGNPGVYTGQGTNTYLLDGGGVVCCIDPGPDDRAHLAAILDAVEARGGRLQTILLTHSHPDHRPLAAELRRRTGARLVAYAPGDERAETPRAQERCGDLVLEAVHTPGHAPDHLCFFEPASRTLFTGDHILGAGTTVIAPPDGDMRAYFDSLRAVRALNPRRLHPGHGPDVEDGVGTIDMYIVHRLEREAQVLALVRTRQVPVTPDDLVPELYETYPQELWPLAAMTVRAHLDKLAADGVIECEEPRFHARPQAG